MTPFENREIQLEEKFKLPLPVVNKTSGAADQNAGESPPVDHFPDVEPCHDRLAGTCVIGEQKTEVVLSQKVVVNGDSLVRQRNHAGKLQPVGAVKHMPVPQPKCIDNQFYGFGIAFKVELDGLSELNFVFRRGTCGFLVHGNQLPQTTEPVRLWFRMPAFPSVHRGEGNAKLGCQLLLREL